MGEAINLVNNFKIESVIFNCGKLNDLEKKLTKVLNQKNIKHEICINNIKKDNYNLEFLNTKIYDNENDTVGIIICKHNNEYVIKYYSDDRIIVREYELV